MSHTFHIPVLGLGFSIDTPLKVSRFGISSVISLVDDILIEEMRSYHCRQNNMAFTAIDDKEEDYRTRRITAYLNLVKTLADRQFEELKKQDFKANTDITWYFDLLPENSGLKIIYNEMLSINNPELKEIFQNMLREKMVMGSIDVNIMSKLDKMNYKVNGEELGPESSDALAALRGYALSDLQSSVVLSAGMNPRLYSYLEQFNDFYPDAEGKLKKQVILKVSDFRSAFIQGKFLAKKGIWVSEYRIESGLNCGGHAFATDGYLMGPILEEFKNKRKEMTEELFELYAQTLRIKEKVVPAKSHSIRITAQGGIGTSEENNFLLNYYKLDATGWGSPFLLVPEATNVDDETLQRLIKANQDDFYISNSSPLGIPFNNFRKSSAEEQRLERIAKGRPGSPCTKKFLVSNTEFTKEPICTASRKYQNFKIKQLQSLDLEKIELQHEIDKVTEKLCLCEGLCSSVHIKDHILKPRRQESVAICPGPNLAYFQGIFTLDEMVKHIYGKMNLFNKEKRSNLFINELRLYVEYLRNDVNEHMKNLSDKKRKYFVEFKNQLLNGIEYYKELIPKITTETAYYRNKMNNELIELESLLKSFQLPAFN